MAFENDYDKTIWTTGDVVTETLANKWETQYDHAKDYTQYVRDNLNQDISDLDNQVNTRIDDHQTAEELDHPDSSVTDSKIGDRNISDTSAPGSDTGLLNTLLDGIANRIKIITGKSDWKTDPATDLGEAHNHYSTTSGVHGVGSSEVESKSGAQDKADTAESNANSYTDTHENKTTGVHGVGTSDVESVAGAQSKADSAESSAKSYTDDHEAKSNPHSASASESYADSVADTAEQNAKDYADTQASNAESNANDYTDQEVSAVQSDLDNHKSSTGSSNPHALKPHDLDNGGAVNRTGDTMSGTLTVEDTFTANGSEYEDFIRNKAGSTANSVLGFTYGDYTGDPYFIGVEVDLGVFTAVEGITSLPGAFQIDINSGDIDTDGNITFNNGSQVESESGAQSKADSAESSAKSYTDSEVSSVQSDLDNHKGNTNNPHEVTVDQVGAVGNKSNIDDYLDFGNSYRVGYDDTQNAFYVDVI